MGSRAGADSNLTNVSPETLAPKPPKPVQVVVGSGCRSGVESNLTMVSPETPKPPSLCRWWWAAAAGRQATACGLQSWCRIKSYNGQPWDPGPETPKPVQVVVGSGCRSAGDCLRAPELMQNRFLSWISPETLALKSPSLCRWWWAAAAGQQATA